MAEKEHPDAEKALNRLKEREQKTHVDKADSQNRARTESNDTHETRRPSRPVTKQYGIMKSLDDMAQQVMLRPQSSWYDQRFVPLHQLIMDQIEDGTLILHCKVVSPFFEYDSGNLFVLRKGEVFYLYSYGEVNNYVTWYKLEKETSTGANDGYLIASSDNDMKQERWLPIIASLCNKTSAKELVELFQKAPVGGELQIRIK